MKRLIRFLIIGAIIIAIIFGAWYFWKITIFKNLHSKYLVIQEYWPSLFDESSRRTHIIDEMIDYYSINDVELISVVNKNLTDRNLFREKYSIEFAKLEYDVNDAYLNAIASLPQNHLDSCLFEDLNSSTIKLNRHVIDYNTAVKDFNFFYSSFPNFIVAKQHGYRREKYLEIKYGERNVDPFEKHQQRQKWIESGQWE